MAYLRLSWPLKRHFQFSAFCCNCLKVPITVRDVVSVSRSRSRDLFLKGLGLGKSWWVSVSSRTENQTSWSRLGLVSVSKLKVSFTSERFLTVKLLIQEKLSSSVRVSHNHNLSAKKVNVGYLFIPNDSFF